MAQRSLGIFFTLAVGLTAVPVVSAQVRQITGQVTNSQTGSGVGEATVAVEGTRIVAQTSTDGKYSLNAPEGDQTLVVRAIGYKGAQVAVPADQATADVSLAPDPFNLEEVVVTGQSTGISKQNLPNAVATVNSDELTRAPTGTLESALQGKIPGALIQQNSGAPGGGIQINLRGVSTINGGVDPLFVVDGIVVSDDAIPNGANAVTAAQAGGNPRNQDNPVNRIADLNPEDIERIEVLKGGSAAAIYGSKATNGVIIITTKKGQTGKPQFNITQRFGVDVRSNTLGSRTFGTLAEALSVFHDTTLVSSIYQPGVTFDHEAELYGQKSLGTETNASVSGGTDQTKYYISGLVKSQPGIGTSTGYKKQSLRVNVDQELSSWIHLSANTNVIHSLSKRGLEQRQCRYEPLPGVPVHAQLRDLEPTQAGATLVPSDFPENPFERSNPLQTFEFLKNDEDTWRALGTLTARMSLLSNARNTVQLITIAGADYFEQDNNFVSPPGLEFEPNDGQPGTVVLGKASNLNLNLAFNGNYIFIPESQKFQSTLSAGVQYGDRKLNATSILGRTLLEGQENPDQATSVTVFQDDRPVRDLGVYGQEELLLMDRRLLLTGGFRADRSSTNGNTDKFFFYPKAAASYRIIKPFGGLDEIKLRGAYGQTGNQPLFGAKFSPDTTGTIGGNFRNPSRPPRRRSDHQAGDTVGVRDRLRRHAGRRPFGAQRVGVSADDQQPAAGADPGAELGAADPHFQLRQQAPEPRRRGLARDHAGADEGRELDLHHDLFEEHQQGHEAHGANIPDRWLRHLARRLPDRAGQLRHPDHRDGGQGGRRGSRLPDVVLERPAVPSRELRLPVGLEAGRRHRQPDGVPLRRGAEQQGLRDGRRAAAGRLRQRTDQDLRPGRFVPQAPGGDAGV